MLPHRSSCAGLTTQATVILALAGAGAAVFLFVIFPRITSSCAAERGRHTLAPEAVEDEARPANTDDVLVLDPSEIPQPAVADEVQESTPTTAVASAPNALVAANAEPEAPKLRYLKSTTRSENVEPGAGRAEQRKNRKEREREAAAMGEVPPEHAAAKVAPPNANRSKLETKGEKGRPGSREQKDKPKGQPKGG